jgi:hypothetical protein
MGLRNERGLEFHREIVYNGKDSFWRHPDAKGMGCAPKEGENLSSARQAGMDPARPQNGVQNGRNESSGGTSPRTSTARRSYNDTRKAGKEPRQASRTSAGMAKSEYWWWRIERSSRGFGCTEATRKAPGQQEQARSGRRTIKKSQQDRHDSHSTTRAGFAFVKPCFNFLGPNLELAIDQIPGPTSQVFRFLVFDSGKDHPRIVPIRQSVNYLTASD